MYSLSHDLTQVPVPETKEIIFLKKNSSEGTLTFSNVQASTQKALTLGDSHGSILRVLNEAITYGALKPKKDFEREYQERYQQFIEDYYTRSFKLLLLDFFQTPDCINEQGQLTPKGISVYERLMQDWGDLLSAIEKNSPTRPDYPLIKFMTLMQSEWPFLFPLQKSLIPFLESGLKSQLKAFFEYHKNVEKTEVIEHSRQKLIKSLLAGRQNFLALINILEMTGKYFILRLIGDETGDRAPWEDSEMLKLISLLYEKGIKVIVLFSNHGAVQCAEAPALMYMGDPNASNAPVFSETRLGSSYARSLYSLEIAIRCGIVSKEEYAKLYKNYVMNHLQLLDISFNECLTIYHHAPAFLETYEALAKELSVHFKCGTPKELMASFEQINSAFRGRLLNITSKKEALAMEDVPSSKVVPIEHPFTRITFNRCRRCLVVDDRELYNELSKALFSIPADEKEVAPGVTYAPRTIADVPVNYVFGHEGLLQSLDICIDTLNSLRLIAKYLPHSKTILSANSLMKLEQRYQLEIKNVLLLLKEFENKVGKVSENVNRNKELLSKNTFDNVIIQNLVKALLTTIAALEQYAHDKPIKNDEHEYTQNYQLYVQKFLYQLELVKKTHINHQVLPVIYQIFNECQQDYITIEMLCDFKQKVTNCQQMPPLYEFFSDIASMHHLKIQSSSNMLEFIEFSEKAILEIPCKILSEIKYEKIKIYESHYNWVKKVYGEKKIAFEEDSKTYYCEIRHVAYGQKEQTINDVNTFLQAQITDLVDLYKKTTDEKIKMNCLANLQVCALKMNLFQNQILNMKKGKIENFKGFLNNDCRVIAENKITLWQMMIDRKTLLESFQLSMNISKGTQVRHEEDDSLVSSTTYD